MSADAQSDDMNLSLYRFLFNKLSEEFNTDLLARYLTGANRWTKKMILWTPFHYVVKRRSPLISAAKEAVEKEDRAVGASFVL